MSDKARSIECPFCEGRIEIPLLFLEKRANSPTTLVSIQCSFCNLQVTAEQVKNALSKTASGEE